MAIILVKLETVLRLEELILEIIYSSNRYLQIKL